MKCKKKCSDSCEPCLNKVILFLKFFFENKWFKLNLFCLKISKLIAYYK